MGAYKNSFTLLCDEDGEVDVSKLTAKAAEMEMKKKLEEESQKNKIHHLLLSWDHSISAGLPDNAAAKEEGGGDEWEVHERRRREGGENKAGSAGTSKERKQVVAEESSEEEYEDEGLVVEQITKGKQRMRRMNTHRKKQAAAYRKFKGFDRH